MEISCHEPIDFQTFKLFSRKTDNVINVPSLDTVTLLWRLFLQLTKPSWYSSSRILITSVDSLIHSFGNWLKEIVQKFLIAWAKDFKNCCWVLTNTKTIGIFACVNSQITNHGSGKFCMVAITRHSTLLLLSDDNLTRTCGCPPEPILIWGKTHFDWVWVWVRVRVFLETKTRSRGRVWGCWYPTRTRIRHASNIIVVFKFYIHVLNILHIFLKY